MILLCRNLHTRKSIYLAVTDCQLTSIVRLEHCTRTAGSIPARGPIGAFFQNCRFHDLRNVVAFQNMMLVFFGREERYPRFDNICPTSLQFQDSKIGGGAVSACTPMFAVL